MKTLQSLALAIFATAVLAGSVHGQNAPINYTNDSFNTNSVLTLAGTTGQEIYGVDFGAGDTSAVTTGNGYDFVNYSTTAGSTDVTLSGYASGNTYSTYLNGDSSGDTNFDQVLNNGAYLTGALTLNGLTPGTTYQVLSFFADKANTPGSFYSLTDSNSSSSPTSTSSAQQYAFSGTTPLGGYVLGTFTADSSGTETFNQVIDGNGAKGFMGVLVETTAAVTTPEPATFALLGLGVLSLVMLARRTSRKA